MIALVLSACSPACPAPSVFGVPPAQVSGRPARLELSLPLDAEGRTRAHAFLASCADDGSSLCDTPLPPEQDCALDALAGGDFAAIAGCKGVADVMVYDARAAAPIAGYRAADWIFAQPATQRLLLFHGYFAQGVK